MLIQHLRTILGSLAVGLLVACATPQAETDPTLGSLAVTVSELPDGLPAAVQITGPNDYSTELTRSATLSGLAPGDYKISASSITRGKLTYFPSAGTQGVEVAAGTSVPVEISYTGMPFTLGIQEVASVTSAVFLTAPPGDARQFIVERSGRVFVRENDAVLETPFLDIRPRVLFEGDRGLLSMAFHPDYASNGYFFVYYVDTLKRIVVERQRVSSDRNRADPGSALAIFVLQQPGTIHYGGLVSFGPDGYLYMAIGDGANGGDPFNNGQRLDTLHGKVLRIDVNNASAAQPYSIPSSNPFVGQPGRRGEIWAYGLRNPWRYSFDARLLYLGDVGQEEREEINITSLTEGGQNFGWRIREGSRCYNNLRCDMAGQTFPVVEYDHASGCSISGGYVYRGSAIPHLNGHYFYADYCRGFVRSFRFTGKGVKDQTDWLIKEAGTIMSFGRDAAGELYVIAGSGKIFKIVRLPAN